MAAQVKEPSAPDPGRMVVVKKSGSTGGIDIKGKWGLGVGVGEKGLPSELWVTRGKTTRTAWLFYVNADQSYSENRDSRGYSSIWRTFQLTLGPGFRRYTRPQERLSPYWDVNFTFGGGRLSSSSYQPPPFTSYTSVSKSASAGISLSGGVEYFLPWHFSLSANTSFLGVSLRREWTSNQPYVSDSRQWAEGMNMRISPSLHVRVYF